MPILNLYEAHSNNRTIKVAAIDRTQAMFIANRAFEKIFVKSYTIKLTHMGEYVRTI